MEREALLKAVTAKFPTATVVVNAPAAVAAPAPGAPAAPPAAPVPTQLPEIKIPVTEFRALMEWLHNGELSLDFPMSMTAVDYVETKTLVCVYHLYSMKFDHKLVVKCDLDRDKASIPTVCDLWRGCEWFEREVFDLFGVNFEDHPDLRRIMMTDDWVGHPLRKDYKDSRIAGKPY
jgi:NADH-quinone oxidoreductase subunit C